MLIGEETIPRRIIEELQDHFLQIFMREPDPTKWPPEMAHLVHYLSVDERLGFNLSAVFAKHFHLLEAPMQAWVRSVWTDLRHEVSATGGDRQMVLEEMVEYCRDLLSRFLEDEG
jgi:hypothetical protein